MSKFLKGTYNGRIITNYHTIPGESAMIGADPNRMWYALDEVHGNYYPLMNIKRLIYSPYSIGAWTYGGPIFTESEIWRFDVKYDDGKPYQGNIVTNATTGGGGNGCGDWMPATDVLYRADPNAGRGTSFLNSNTVNCPLFFVNPY